MRGDIGADDDALVLDVDIDIDIDHRLEIGAGQAVRATKPGDPPASESSSLG